MTNFKIHHKEKMYYGIMCVISAKLYALLAWGIVTQSVPLHMVISYTIAFWVMRKLSTLFLLGYLRGNCIKVGENQLPEVYTLVKEHAQALELATVPDTYILQGNGMLNAFATRLSGRNFVVLYSDVLELAYQEGVDAVSFIIGHEMGHIKRNHVTMLKNICILPATMIPFMNWAYSRAREYTCDNIGFAVSPHGALKGLLLLGAGKKLYSKISVNQLLMQAAQDQGWATLVMEVCSTHPLLCNRLASVNKQYEEFIVSDNACFVSPFVKNSADEQRV